MIDRRGCDDATKIQGVGVRWGWNDGSAGVSRAHTSTLTFMHSQPRSGGQARAVGHIQEDVEGGRSEGRQQQWRSVDDNDGPWARHRDGGRCRPTAAVRHGAGRTSAGGLYCTACVMYCTSDEL